MAGPPKIGSATTSPPTGPILSTAAGIGNEHGENPAQSMQRYRSLIARTVDAFGDEIKASRWLSLPNRDFGGQTPIQVAQKDGYDLRTIEPFLIRIEHGVDF